MHICMHACMHTYMHAHKHTLIEAVAELERALVNLESTQISLSEPATETDKDFGSMLNRQFFSVLNPKRCKVKNILLIESVRTQQNGHKRFQNAGRSGWKLLVSVSRMLRTRQVGTSVSKVGNKHLLLDKPLPFMEPREAQ